MQWIPITSDNIDWISLIFIVILGIIAFATTYYSYRFKEFLNLLTNNKYIILFNKKERTNAFFTVLLLVVQWLVIGITLYLSSEILNINIAFGDIPHQYIILCGVALFIFLKLILQKFISYVFGLESFYRSYTFIRLSYSNYASFILFFIIFFNIYGMNNNIYVYIVSIIIFLYIQISGLFSFARLYKNEIKNYWYYFILYLCTLEVAPYVFIKYLIIPQ